MSARDVDPPAPPVVVVEPAPGTAEPDWAAALTAQTPTVFRYRVPYARGLWVHHAVRAVHDKVCGLVAAALTCHGYPPQVRTADPHHLRDPNARASHGSVWSEFTPLTAAYAEKYITHPLQRGGGPVDVYEHHGTQVATHALWVSTGTVGRWPDAPEVLECRLATWLWPRRFGYPGGSATARTILRRGRVHADDQGGAARLVHGMVAPSDPVYVNPDYYLHRHQLSRREAYRYARTTWPLLHTGAADDRDDVNIDVADVLAGVSYADAEVLADPNADVSAVHAVVEQARADWKLPHYRLMYEVWFEQYVRKIGTDIARSI